MTKHSSLRLLSALAVLLVALGLEACSSERQSLLGRTYNNVAARDNGYFLAREKLRATEAALYKERPNDYNRILALSPVLDDATATRIAADLEDIIKKASIPIQHRPGSDWTDDSYLLIGKARYYKREYEDAAKTFKYANTTSKDANTRHAALIWLMRTFVTTKEYDNAAAVSALLDKEQGTEANARELFLTRAEYYLATGDQKLAIENLNRAIPYITPKNEQSRTRYILAQLYQAQGQDKEAYAQLNRILKRNPPYELDFFSKLMLGQVSNLDATDRARLDKYFAKLIKDEKNKEYTDKIYYEMARIDYRQQRYDQALALLRKSARATTTNKAQKSYTYLLAGRIYYENLQKYRLAAAYYDSTVQNMPKEAPEYAATAERAGILKDFTTQLTIVETQDSLQALARLDAPTLEARLTAYATAELEARRKQEEKQLALREQDARRQQAAINGSPTTTGNAADMDPLAFANSSTGAQWYFDNPNSLGTARADFIRRWGDRPLQDNWRVTSQSSSSPVTSQGGNVPLSVAGTSGTSVNPPKDDPAAADPAVQTQALVGKYRLSLPLTESQLKTSQQQVEEALFALGAIYNQQLREQDRAIETYEKLLTRFPAGTHVAETYYSLYLLYKEKGDGKAETYAQKLRTEFPKSSYAKLVADPEYLRRASLVNEQVTLRLDSAFTFYKKQEFKKATAVLARVSKAYPENDMADRVGFLKTLVAIRTLPPVKAKEVVLQFKKDFPDSPLNSNASLFMEAFRKYDAGQIAGALASTEKPVVSMFRPGEVDNRIRILYSENESPAVALSPAQPKQPEPKAAVPDKQPATPSAESSPKTPAPKSAPAKEAPASKTVEPAAVPAPAGGSSGPVPAPAKPATAYTANSNSPHAVVLVFPAASPVVGGLPAQLNGYHARLFRDAKLQVQATPMRDSLVLVVVQALPGVKAAQTYALKLRTAQSPMSRLRGVGYQTLLIGMDNLPLLLQSQDIEEYKRFYQQTYPK
ncbi:hypothetical protein LJY25_06240 [Hymenobacter sp. BT175]|uniref:type IX secretion system periplasmic lipoprotein PorW/SprE n=1 Tax=Hymenobacter translucens TaxID=2886507 RepID=UPI001D0F2F75|nr:tetratricopeptide repeat protein [Hymenobacter translucens]MCC2546037.1 hypothetical protein [Hymenobacter translucens]